MLFQLWQRRLQHPCMREYHVVALFWIVDQIVDTGHRVFAQYTVPPSLFLEMKFPVLPLHAEYVVPHVHNETISS